MGSVGKWRSVGKVSNWYRRYTRFSLKKCLWEEGTWWPFHIHNPAVTSTHPWSLEVTYIISFEFGSRELTIPKRSQWQNCQEIMNSHKTFWWCLKNHHWICLADWLLKTYGLFWSDKTWKPTCCELPIFCCWGAEAFVPQAIHLGAFVAMLFFSMLVFVTPITVRIIGSSQLVSDYDHPHLCQPFIEAIWKGTHVALLRERKLTMVINHLLTGSNWYDPPSHCENCIHTISPPPSLCRLINATNISPWKKKVWKIIYVSFGIAICRSYVRYVTLPRSIHVCVQMWSHMSKTQPTLL